jgi:predicted amidohydrolase
MDRVAVVQLVPKLEAVAENIEKARELCSRHACISGLNIAQAQAKEYGLTVDLVCLAEVIFTSGHNVLWPCLYSHS